MIGFAFAGLLLGLILGVYCPFRVPPEYARLLAVAVMAGMDAVLGGVRASLEGNYDTQVFISGFFINGILAAFLCYACYKNESCWTSCRSFSGVVCKRKS